jgi:hypothetical protein
MSLKDYNLADSDVITFKQPVYLQGYAGEMYVPGQSLPASEVTEHALSFKGAYSVKKAEVVAPAKASTKKVKEEAPV